METLEKSSQAVQAIERMWRGGDGWMTDGLLQPFLFSI
jgi:hypothetical protein